MSRSANSKIHLQPRDYHLLRGLFEMRVMNATHMALLYFGGRKEAAKKRLQKLKRFGFVAERRRRVYQPVILMLGRAGFIALHNGGHLADFSKLAWRDINPTRMSIAAISHRLAIIDIQASLSNALRNDKRHSLIDFTLLSHADRSTRTSSTFCQDPIEPDALIRIGDRHSKRHQEFFLQMDRPRDTFDRITHRVAGYRDYYKRGEFARLHGGRNDDYKTYPFRVLYVFRNARRRNNALEHLLLTRRPPLRMVWFAILSEMIADALGSVWITPHAYREATQATQFTPARAHASKDGSAIDRDNHIEGTVIHHTLLQP